MQGWVIIYAMGAAQAAVLALALWRRPANAPANRVLAVWIALVCVDLAVKAAYLASPTPAGAIANRVVAQFPFLHASLFYVYVRVLTTGRGVNVRDLAHLAGFALALLLAFTVRPDSRLYDLWLFGYAFSYIGAALVRITRYRRLLRQRRADADRQSMRWLGTLAVGQLAIWLIAAAPLFADVPYVDYYLIYGAVAAWVFVVGYFSLAQPPVVEAPPEPVGAPADASFDQAADTATEGADDARFPEVEARLSRLMEEESLYREPALTIAQVARRSGYPEYLVSAVINRRLGGNFWEFVNRLRIEAVRADLEQPGDTRTILDIAYDCGFTSKSTFNAAFKRQLGETPSAYRRRHAAPAPAGGAAATRTPPG